MDLLDEIRQGFANLDQNGRMLPINALPNACPAWIFREGELFGVAIELHEYISISEGFSGAHLRTVERLINGQLRRFLRLESSTEWLRNEFGVICEHMVAVGKNNDARKKLIENPLAWWERWRHLLGNALVNRSSYETLAELLAIERLVQLGLSFEWRGPFGGTIDIHTDAENYEVKSTISRYDSRIHVAGQFQLALSLGKPLNLLHYRFEPAASGESIDFVCNRLIAAGVSTKSLESALLRCGLEAGCSARKESFNLLEVRLFPVDVDFPKITPESFLGGVLPAGVVHVEYQVDLAGLTHQPF
ncbi:MULTISPECIES: PD-(D/E)XK motif protein [Pseudomonas]|uniref:PD-(D/E)XK motif protein n=1 Tax=Pseudomonas TaxID=286 RepID=UPI001BE6F8AC|nr:MULTISPECIES: PD-(D/E)XK motif protein [Pseudomonas]MBT2342141.1 PD-(D/E)XK motif protein [Pseudomonas fluorescens]MCD4528751.1 PD-(D/E)XK motif protein [Pseudomonas sp. C3-2018]